MSIAKAKAHLETLRLILEEAFEDGYLAGAASVPFKVAIKDEVAQVLTAALNGEQGWRSNARRILGMVKFIKCDCGAIFESGGKQKRRCSDCTQKNRR